MSSLISFTSRCLPRKALNLRVHGGAFKGVRVAAQLRHVTTLNSCNEDHVMSYYLTKKRISGYNSAIFNQIHSSARLLQTEVVNVPDFADSVSEGDVKFTCKVGDVVKADQNVMEIETDKTTVGVPAPFNGVIEEIMVKDGDTVKSRQPLFKLKKTEGGAAAPEPPKPAAAAPPPPPPAAAAAPPPPAAAGGSGRTEVVNVPDFADSVSEGDVKFTSKVGDTVNADQNVMEIETDKTTVGVPAPFAGVIEEIMVKDGDTVKARQPLFKLKQTAGGAAPPPPAAAAPPPKPAAAPPPPAPAAPQPAARPPPAPKAAAPPPKPSAPAAKIPVPKAPGAATVKVPPEDYTREITGTRTEQRVKMNRMRIKIAERLKEAQNVNAMLTTFNEIDMSAAMSFRKANLEAFQKKYGIKIGFMSIFSKASAYALQDQPVVNAVIEGNEIVYRDYVDISVAVATPKGLVVPVLRNVESMNYADIEIAMAALGDKARKGAITVEDMDGGTFTISNGGVFGSLMGTPIINPPQSSILGMHGIFERPIAIKGQVVIRPMMYVALTYDHRLIDGREAVMFLRKIKDAVEDPRIMLAGL